MRTPKPLDLAQQIQSIVWFQFEKIVATAYKSRGFRVCRRGGANPDGGIDLILEESGQRTGLSWPAAGTDNYVLQTATTIPAAN